MKFDPDKVSVKDVMHPGAVSLDVDATVESAIEMFEDSGISGAPVIDESGSLCGVLTSLDLLDQSPVDETALEAQGSDSKESDTRAPAAGGRGRVGDWMSREVISVGPDATLGEVCDVMSRETVHRVFVTDGERLLGVVSASDVVNYVAKSSSAWTGSEEA